MWTGDEGAESFMCIFWISFAFVVVMGESSGCGDEWVCAVAVLGCGCESRDGCG